VDTEPKRLLQAIHDILKTDPDKMYSREEILNRLVDWKQERQIEQLLAELEVASSGRDDTNSDVFATCRGGTVYYKWNRT
jgi:transcription elongation factor GreA-like protein